MGKAESKTLAQFKKGETVFKIGDNVLARSDTSKPFVGKVREISSRGRTTEVQLAWFYRPEEAMGGRKEFHGDKELFKSDHLDWVDVATITRKCRVHSMADYQELKTVKSDDFFSRFTYLPQTHEFRPDRVPVFCNCEMPYNPDKYMIMCDQCQDWYHPECQDYTEAQVNDQSSFICRSCVEKAAREGNSVPEAARDSAPGSSPARAGKRARH